ncbi:MAG: hypothetical protein Q8919_03465, partial [Bacteroidota bacterium]|nr:hypothetical protein [Bacteroidota bacterium]
MFSRKGFVFFVFLVLLVGVFSNAFSTTLPIEGVSYSVVVIDSTQDTPLQLARVSLRKNGALVVGKITDPTGRATFSDIKPGWYIISVQLVDYVSYSDSILIDKFNSTKTVYLREVIHEELTVTGEHDQNITTIDPKTGAQVFEAETYHPSPIARMTNLIQENMIGAAKAPTGEVHIRGQHGEYMYYVDGIPIPLGVFGGLNEVVDSKVIERATFLTGGFPAEYGGQMAAVIDVQNRVPGGKAHFDLSTYAGSYLGRDNNSPDSLGIHSQKLRPFSVNGQALSFSDHLGKLGVFLSGSRQETDRRIDSPLPFIYHDHGFDYFLYGKLDYLAGDNDYLTMNLNFGRTQTEIPYDPIEEGPKDDHQQTSNAFQTLSLFHTVSREADKESNVFIGFYAREGGLIFSPGAVDAHNFRFPSDTTKGYTLAEDRGFTTFGTRVKYDLRFSHEFMVAAGLSLSVTRGTENFSSMDSNGSSGPVIATNYVGSDFGFFAQSEIHPAEWTAIDLGIRYDQHIAPDAPFQKQISPRLKRNIFFDENATAYLYSGRLFMPNNIEGLRTISSNVAGNTAFPTVAESDDMYEAAFLYNLDFGLRSKLAFFRKLAVPGVDDQTVGSSAVKTPVNISKVVTN